MEKIVAYKTTDGVIFKDENTAKSHQGNIDLKAEIKYLVDSNFESILYRTSVHDFIIEHRSDIYKALKKYYRDE